MKYTNPAPPLLATRLLRAFLLQELIEEVTGDLEEVFQANCKRRSLFAARVNYWYQVINYIRPFALRRSRSYQINSLAMFHNYWKITWRLMSRQKLYSAINIGGFAIGITACLLITLYIRHELSFDKYYGKSENIYRIYRESKFNGEFHSNAWFPAPMASALLAYPEIVYAGHYVSASNLTDGRSEIRRADKKDSFFEDQIVYANQDLLNILETSFIAGNPARALHDAHTVVITQRKAEKYFPGEDPLGKSLILNNDEQNPFKITGVIEDFPANTHFQSDFVLSVEGHEFWPGEQNAWGNSNYFDYILVRSGTDIRGLEAKLMGMVEQYFMPDAVKSGDGAQVIAWVKSLRFKLQPVADVHMNTLGVGDDQHHGEIRYVWLFGSVSVFILIIASINFINLSTARSANRAKEVGLRKVVGSQRGALIRQFLTESLVYSMMSFFIACGLAYLLLPYFSDMIGTRLVFNGSDLPMIPVLLLMACLVGLLAGVYPSFYLSSFKPAQIFQGKVKRGAGHQSMRSLLVVCQYTISIALIIGTVVIGRQTNYIMTKKLGFDKEQVLVVQSTHSLGNRISLFKQDIRKLRGVSQVSISGFLPVGGARRNGSGTWKDVEKSPAESIDTQQWTVDEDYIETLGLSLLEGRNFSPEIASDSQAIIINKSLAKSLNMREPIGQIVVNPWNRYTVIGVVEDFHFESMKQNISGLGLLFGRNEGAVSIKLKSDEVESTVQAVTALWKKYAPDQSIRYTFLDQSYAQMYGDVTTMNYIMTAFTILAIVVASLGLFALSAYTVEQRTKEISIRIVLGASVASIWNLLTKNFVFLVMISFIVAAPLAWFAMTAWLQDYAYKIDIGWDVFVVTSVIAMAIALLTISYQSLKAALVNPAKNLRSE